MGQTATDVEVIPRAHPEGTIAIVPVMSLVDAKARLAQFRAFVAEELHEGEDYGLIPGVKQKSLWKPGADKLCWLYGLTPTFPEVIRTINWKKNLFDYEVLCRLINKRDGSIVGEAWGCCSSMEKKYRFRKAERRCPKCGAEAIRRGKTQGVNPSPQWYCAKNAGGCGKNFSIADPTICSQEERLIENDDLPSVKNTILRMAEKRAYVAAVVAATASSGIFSPGGAREVDVEKRASEHRVSVAGTHQKLVEIAGRKILPSHQAAELESWLKKAHTAAELTDMLVKVEAIVLDDQLQRGKPSDPSDISKRDIAWQ
jgi:hypothetical protein